MSKGEDELALHLRAEGFQFVREHRFGAEACGGPGKGLRKRLEASGLRDWRFDMAMPEIKLAIEVEGGGWSGGRHTRGAGFEGDLMKYDAASRLGWTIYRCSPAMVSKRQAVETIKIIAGLKDSALGREAR